MKNHVAFFCAILFVIPFLNSCSKDNNEANTISIEQFCLVAPNDWQCELITENFNAGDIPANAPEPQAIIRYSNYSKEFSVSRGSETNPSLILNLYPISKKTDLLDLIESQQMYSWCIPVYYGETANYFIVSSPCFANSGVFTEQANNSIADLHSALKTIIVVNDYGLVPFP